MNDNQQNSPENKNNKTESSASIKRLIIAKLILLIIMTGIAYYLFMTI